MVLLTLSSARVRTVWNESWGIEESRSSSIRQHFCFSTETCQQKGSVDRRHLHFIAKTYLNFAKERKSFWLDRHQMSKQLSKSWKELREKIREVYQKTKDNPEDWSVNWNSSIWTSAKICGRSFESVIKSFGKINYALSPHFYERIKSFVELVCGFGKGFTKPGGIGAKNPWFLESCSWRSTRSSQGYSRVLAKYSQAQARKASKATRGA
jgi:hypothetical protein